MNRKNINRGFKKLRVWQDAISLYVITYKMFSNFHSNSRKLQPIALTLPIVFQGISQKATVVAVLKNI